MPLTALQRVQRELVMLYDVMWRNLWICWGPRNQETNGTQVRGIEQRMIMTARTAYALCRN